MSLYPDQEIKLNWPEIFQRVIIEKRGGICYERNELLYQALIKFGYTAHRIECVYKDRMDHLGLVVQIDTKWYFCDVAYVAILAFNAIELVSAKETECEIGTWRPLGIYEKEMSTLVPSLPKYWRMETKDVNVTYDTHAEKAKRDTWTREIDFVLESRSLSDFSEKV